jgi:hypothetical protein
MLVAHVLDLPLHMLAGHRFQEDRAALPAALD